MSIDFDAARATLRLDVDAFITLTELSSEPGDSGDPGGTLDSSVDRLVDAGAVLDGAPHPALRRALAAVSGSLASLQVLVACPRDVRLHHGWLCGDAALLTDLGDGTYDFAAVDGEFVPESIARATHLGPRPRLADGSAVVDEAVLDDLASNAGAARDVGAETLADVLAPWPAAAAAVRAGSWHLSVVDVSFADAGRTVARRLAWVDTDAGTLRVEADEHGPVLVPAAPTELWHAVVAILPDELDPGAVARSA